MTALPAIDGREDPVPLRSALEAMPDGIAIFDAADRLVACNRRYRDMFPMMEDVLVPGVGWDVLMRMAVTRGQLVDHLDDVDAFMERATAHRLDFDNEIVAEHADGRSYLVNFKRLDDGGWMVMRRDISERKQAEALLGTVLDASPVAVLMARLEDGMILYSSEEARAMFGDPTHVDENYLSDADRKAYVDALRQQGRINGYRLRCRRKDGSRFDAIASGRILDYNGRTCVVTAITDLTEQMERDALIRHVMEACPAPIQMVSVDSGEIIFSSPETVSLFGPVKNARRFYVDVAQRAVLLDRLRREGTVTEFQAEFYNREGKVFRGAVSARLIRYRGADVLVSHTRDMSEQLAVESELNSQRDQLFQNEKMSALGELLAGVAHELNNPLSVVIGHALMLREDCSDPDMLRQIGKVSDAAERCTKIVRTFLTMARQQPAKAQDVSVNEIVQTASDVARYGDLGFVDIACDLAEDLPNCFADADQLTQVVLNLILNAEHAIRDSGTGRLITVRTRHAAAKDRVVIEVEDDGPGIPKQDRSRVFEPFFTTKDLGQGTGIGLTLCHRIVRAHDGQIRLDREVESGTRIVVELPVQSGRGTASRSQGEPTAAVAGSARVLIVDDEADVADLNAEILARAGFEVDIANTARDGIGLLREKTYDLVLSDLNMPELDGRGFYDAILADFPELSDRTGFVTGDTMGRASQTFLKEADRPYLEKPASPRELRDFANAILQTAGART
ncbi:ATP-binding protein [Sulfitobacter sp. D35]|uniref:ATP-binding protein n=1 Tax=Sulfitobacter sp. D35 TaxID=3083252 RepID=UPI0029700187|nr:ATP-binding protein [Sulfitobacter sp. D35]MDW4500347.1 ATP-binding protein [Sulfitobacter sp. D35]